MDGNASNFFKFLVFPFYREKLKFEWNLQMDGIASLNLFTFGFSFFKREKLKIEWNLQMDGIVQVFFKFVYS